MKFLKIPLKIFLLIVFASILSKGWILFNSSFRLDKIDPKELFDNHFDIDLIENKDLLKILSQKYKILDKGRQSFVFESEDKNYVIKLFRFHRYRQSIFCNLLSSFNVAKNYTKKIQDEKNDMYFKAMNSFKLVYENLKEETATLYVHLNKTNHLNKIKIEDKFKQEHVIDLNDFGFVVQKKANSFKKALLNAKNDKKAFENLLASFFNNLQVIYKKKLLNKDRHVLQNLGVIDGNKVVEIDIGRFVLKKEFNQKKIKKEAYHYTTYLKKWLLKNKPDSVEFFDQKLIEVTKNEPVTQAF